MPILRRCGHKCRFFRGKDDKTKLSLKSKEAKKVFYHESDSINVLNLSTRSYNALYKAGILTIGDLQALSEADLHNIKNLGVKSIQEILDVRASRQVWTAGYSLEETPAEEHTPSFTGDDGIAHQDIQ